MRPVFGLAFLVLVVACGNDDCPSSRGLTCSGYADGATCHDTTEQGDPLLCRCAGGYWTCTDCPAPDSPSSAAFPDGACAAGSSCSVFGFENACGCTCQTDGSWHCAVDDPSPNFHCSF